MTHERSVDDEYEVYSALVRAWSAGNTVFGADYNLAGPRIAKCVAIAAYTSLWRGCYVDGVPQVHTSWLAKVMPGATPWLLERFLELNAESVRLRDAFHLPLPVCYVLPEELHACLCASDGGGWKEFYRRYTGAQGLLTLSRVAFSEDARTAFFYAGDMVSELSGSGGYILAERREDGWEVVGQAMFWEA